MSHPGEKSLEHSDRSEFLTNLVRFGRILRAAGLPVGTGRILQAVRAVRQVGVSNRGDFYWTLHAVFVSHPRHRYLFEQAFRVFWKNPKLPEQAIAMLLPQAKLPEDESRSKELARRIAEQLYPHQIDGDQYEIDDVEFELRASPTYSSRERLQNVDFEAMSSDELDEAKQLIGKMRMAFADSPTRRFRPHVSGPRLDMRRTLKSSLKGGSESIALIRCKLRKQQTPVIVLCDISGSMSEYSRMMLHFMHSLKIARPNVSSFVFGTRLTSITRQLEVRDVDQALDDITAVVEDWHGGTRISDCLKEFNRNWVRRLPTHRAMVLLVTDGLDRSKSADLTPQIQLLQRSCKKLIWLNPLLRYQEFEPKVSAIRALLPYVDAFLPVHNLASLASLAETLTQSDFERNAQLQKNKVFWKSKWVDASPFSVAENVA